MNDLSFIDSIFNDFLSSNSKSYFGLGAGPLVDVKEDENFYSLEMELPGRTENDVDIELDHDNLTIASKKENCNSENDVSENDEKMQENENAQNDDSKKCRYILKERRCCNFERRFSLPSDVDTNSISANFKNGILTIMMAKKEKQSPKKIAIQAV